ncbi:hypothetical protein L1267_12145 [Pseudoalteromonas sp. OFAV1]|jgi:hypothetical protein|uniref:hypothetical protein n=1 Tax=Pseudoalteromonas sp. OFAV1 TaxID=2908892 RepID=UPI001F1986F6|nr:hypothetical protein [Pseudoalteromonas sp. OFAV1]MCF2901142.1 hypothetical protein [Pseudoalteromonas sp. OFAV1]
MAIKFHSHLLDTTERIVFFDIDSTLTSAVDHHILNYQPAYRASKQAVYDRHQWKTIKFGDYIELSSSCLALFANFLAQTGARAVCVSSWNCVRHDGIYLQELQQAFETISEFPKDWLLGFSGVGGGDRWKWSITPFLLETGFKGDLIAIDDKACDYSNQNIAIKVDSLIGFSYREYEKGLSRFGIDEGLVYQNE